MNTENYTKSGKNKIFVFTTYLHFFLLSLLFVSEQFTRICSKFYTSYHTWYTYPKHLTRWQYIQGKIVAIKKKKKKA